MADNAPSGEKETGETLYTCQACSTQLSPRNCLPFILPCHHTVCATCLGRLRRGSNSICPTCDGVPSTLESAEPLPLTSDEALSGLEALSREVSGIEATGQSKEIQQQLQKTLNALVMKASLLKRADAAAIAKAAGTFPPLPDSKAASAPEPAPATQTGAQEERPQTGRQARKKRNKSNRKKRAAENAEKKVEAAEQPTASKAEAPAPPEKAEVVDDPCETHPTEQLRYYCRTCQTPACRICVNNHNERVGHEVVDIEIAAEEARKEVLAMCGELEQIQHTAHERVQELQTNLAEMDAGHNQAIEDLNDHFANVIATIRAREAEVMADIESKVAQQKSQLENYVDDLRSLQSAVDTTSAMGRRLAAVGGDPDALQRRFDHLQTLMAAVPDPPALEPLVNIDELQVTELQDVISRLGQIHTYYDSPTDAGKADKDKSEKQPK